MSLTCGATFAKVTSFKTASDQQCNTFANINTTTRKLYILSYFFVREDPQKKKKIKILLAHIIMNNVKSMKFLFIHVCLREKKYTQEHLLYKTVYKQYSYTNT